MKANRIHLGIRINHPPHLGTYLILACSFVLAKELRATVLIQALDNAPVEIVGDLQRPLYAASSESERRAYIEEHYTRWLQEASALTENEFDITLYTEEQSRPDFRRHFLRTMPHYSNLKWSVSPLHAVLGYELVGIRFPCDICGLSTGYGESTKLIHYDDNEALFESICRDHGKQEIQIQQENQQIIDVQKIFRNIIKESRLLEDKHRQHLILKGSDWHSSCLLVDQGIKTLGYADRLPRRFLPVLTTERGVKLSKSAIHQGSHDFEGLPQWITHASGYLQERDSVKNLLDAARRILELEMVPETPLPLSQFQAITGFSV